MRYRHLGDSGLQVSELCMGTMTFGHNFGVIGVVGQRRPTLSSVPRSMLA